jgi:hypothetical protein
MTGAAGPHIKGIALRLPYSDVEASRGERRGRAYSLGLEQLAEKS